ncbi:MAG: ABC transporter permease [Candidatus Eremiobacteraeota bacterium]|nr:ABC transporter permease [Candidatus Eremiobacteraeota bacterium]
MIVAFFGEALRVLSENKVRSILTLLGLIIGVMAVIAIQVLGKGMSGSVAGVLGNFNEHSFTIFPNFRQPDFARAALKLSDIQKLKSADANIEQVLPAGGATRQARFGSKKARLVVYGESENRFITTPIQSGRSFDAQDIALGANVCLLSADGFKKIIPQETDPVGQSLRVGERRFVIIGVLAPATKGILSQALRTGDVAIPFTTYEREYLRGKPVFALRFFIKDDTQMGATEVAVIKALQAVHHGKFQYQTFDRKTISAGIDGIFGAVTFIVALIGAVSLLVAGIGILNIMLVSVAERTREIGLRKAIGATRFQISLQFFIEALLLSSFGCAIGLVLGLLIGGLVNRFALVSLSGVVAPIPWVQSVVIAVTFATLVTVAFGTYPAYRASRLDPIEALRYE